MWIVKLNKMNERWTKWTFIHHEARNNTVKKTAEIERGQQITAEYVWLVRSEIPAAMMLLRASIMNESCWRGSMSIP